MTILLESADANRVPSCQVAAVVGDEAIDSPESSMSSTGLRAWEVGFSRYARSRFQSASQAARRFATRRPLHT